MTQFVAHSGNKFTMSIKDLKKHTQNFKYSQLNGK